MIETLEALFEEYWPHVLLLLSIVCAAVAATHAAMNKTDVRAAVGWVGVILLSPILGALLYLIVGVNRVRKDQILQEHDRFQRVYKQPPVSEETLQALTPSQRAMYTLGNRVSSFPLSASNHVTLLRGGDATYAAMLEAIEQAKSTIALQSYIFDDDAIGQRFVQALSKAQERGVTVRILIDAVGVRYSHPRITRSLRKAKLPVALFMTNPFGLRTPYANLRSHRKILVLDGHIGFTGGMNIRAGFSHEISGEAATLDTHFKFQGPLVRQLLTAFMHAWDFTTREALSLDDWCLTPMPCAPQPHVPARGVCSGPDSSIYSTHHMLQGAFALAQRHIRIQSPYFLPDPVLIGALGTAARRGVRVDIVIPGNNNLKLVKYSMLGQLDSVIRSGCRVWRTAGTFDHSKLLTIDDSWSYVGSSNMDPRSLRLNFEMDVEIHDEALAQQIAGLIDANMAGATEITLQTLAAQSFPKRLRNRVVWLASPYL